MMGINLRATELHEVTSTRCYLPLDTSCRPTLAPAKRDLTFTEGWKTELLLVCLLHVWPVVEQF